MPEPVRPAKSFRGLWPTMVLAATAAISLALAVAIIIHRLPEGDGGSRQGFQLPTLLIWVGLTSGAMAAHGWKRDRIREHSIADEHRWAHEEADLDCRELAHRHPVPFWKRWVWPSVDDPRCEPEKWARLTQEFPASLHLSEGLIMSLFADGRMEEGKAEIVRIQQLGLREGTRIMLWEQWLLCGIRAAGESLSDVTVNEALHHVSARGQAHLLDLAVCSCFMRPVGNQLLSLADRLSERALVLDPQSPTLRGTRGSVLAELGLDAEAESLLRPIFDSSQPGINRCYSALYLAIISARRGDINQAAELARIARHAEGDSYISDRLKAVGL